MFILPCQVYCVCHLLSVRQLFLLHFPFLLLCDIWISSLDQQTLDIIRAFALTWLEEINSAAKQCCGQKMAVRTSRILETYKEAGFVKAFGHFTNSQKGFGFILKSDVMMFDMFFLGIIPKKILVSCCSTYLLFSLAKFLHVSDMTRKMANMLFAVDFKKKFIKSLSWLTYFYFPLLRLSVY